MRTTAYVRLKHWFTAGGVYRREDLLSHSSNVDRDLARLVREGHLKRLNQGLYLYPETTTFGEAPPDERALLTAFLKDDHFVVYSPNAFNSLGLGMTQLYNQRVIFNRKRHGEFTLGGRAYLFYRWREAPKRITEEFLVIELLNRLNTLGEDREAVLAKLRARLPSFDQRALKSASKRYGTYSAQLKLSRLLDDREKGSPVA